MSSRREFLGVLAWIPMAARAVKPTSDVARSGMVDVNLGDDCASAPMRDLRKWMDEQGYDE